MGPRKRVRPPAGFRVGHWTDGAGLTGCTVVLCGDGARAAVSVSGGAPGTRETDLLRPGMLVQQVHAVLLSGGSAFGLEAASGVVAFLESEGIGFPTPYARVPIVPAAVLYDLGLGDASARPGSDAGLQACKAASDGEIPEGSIGAGTGASSGKALGLERAMKTGVGAASIALAAGGTVTALAVANCYGEVVDPATGAILAGARGPSGLPTPCEPAILGAKAVVSALMNTALVVVMTDLEVSKAQLGRVAEQANDGLARAVRPCHTPFDGDTIFSLSSGRSGLRGDPVQLGTAAVDVVSRALVRAATEATGAGGLPSYRDLDAVGGAAV